MNRAGAARLAVFGLVAILTLTSCAATSPSGAATSPSGAATSAKSDEPTGTIKFGVNQLPPSMDPNATFLTLSQWAYHAFADALTFVTEKGELQPALALKWQAVAPTIWEFKLRPDVKFQNGDAFTARDVKFTFDRVLDPKKQLLQSTRIQSLESVEIVDDLTVRFKTKLADPIWPGRASMIRIAPSAYVTKVGDAEYAKLPIGTGAFKVREFVPNQRISFDAWDGSWRGKPKAKAIEAYLVSDPATFGTALKSGQFNLVKGAPYDQLEPSKGEGFSVASVASWRVYLLEFNQSEIFADNRVRQAFNYAVDKETIAKKIFFGYATPAPGQMSSAGTFGNNPAVKAFPYDSAMAKSLLDQAGWKVGPDGIRSKDGRKLEVTAEYGAGDPFNIGESAVTQAVSQYLSDVGIKVKLLASERAAMLPRLTSNADRYELTHGGWTTSPVPDADAVYAQFSCTGTGQARIKVCDPANDQYEKLFAAQRSELDRTKRAQLFDQIAVFVHERPIGIYLVQPATTWVSNGASGVTPRPDELTIFDTVVVVK